MMTESLIPFPHSLRIAKMNKEMREMDGFAQSGHSEGLGGAGRGGAGDLIGQTKKSFQAFKSHLSGWSLGGQNE